MGKSAQIPLHTWLPDAMEGPTPVSALIHAATMVTAGVFMVARLSPLFEYAPTALAVVGVIGGTTCIFAASVGMVQNDIKKVVAYSTCSQLGYMFVAAGVSAYAAGVFHLFTHAFFKGLLFLCCGSVIHAMGGEQDMRRMGGLWRKTPWTYVTMWVGALSLSGIPPFSGYWSKDTIIDADWASGTAVGHYAWCLGTLAAFMTAFYISRVMFMTFHGEPRADEETMHHAHESPWVMRIPLIVLAIGAAFFGWLGYGHFVGADSVGFWKTAILVLPGHDALARAEDIPLVIAYLPLVCGIAGIAMAYLFYIVDPRLPLRLAQRYPRALSVPAEQMVFRRALRFAVRAPGDGARRRAVEIGRRRGHRRARAERHRRPDPRSGASGKPAADRLSLSLRLRHADRAGGVRNLVPVAALSEGRLS